AARWRGQDLVIKRYRQAAIEKHARLACEPLAEFEYRRNRACHSVAGLQRHVARPIGFLVGTGSQWLLQERIDGRLCSELGASWPDEKWRAVQARLGELVELAHLAGVHDLDLHPRNVMLTVGPVMVEPVLFDFNLVPFTERR